MKLAKVLSILTTVGCSLFFANNEASAFCFGGTKPTCSVSAALTAVGTSGKCGAKSALFSAKSAGCDLSALDTAASICYGGWDAALSANPCFKTALCSRDQDLCDVPDAATACGINCDSGDGN